MATSSPLFKVLLLLNLLLTVAAQQVFENKEAEHPLTEEQYRLYLQETELSATAFNYSLNGTDWTGLCHSPNFPQSPYNLSAKGQVWQYVKYDFLKKKNVTVTVNQTVSDWKDNSFSFITRYRPTVVNTSMPVNYVKMMTLNVTDTDEKGLFGFWAEEPFYFNPQPQSHIVEWSFDSLRAHYPSEHRIENVMADLEIQLFHLDLKKQSFACNGKKAAIVLLFNINSTESNNGFFDDFTKSTGDDKGKMDISKLLDLASSMKSNISGYVGTDSMPPCSKGVCYYVYEKIFTITQEQLDYFKVDQAGGKDANTQGNKLYGNARNTNQGAGEKYKYTLRNTGFFAKQ